MNELNCLDVSCDRMNSLDGHPSQVMIRDWLASVERADIADWVTVGAYLIAALLCARAAGQARPRGQARERMFWRITAAFLIFLGINELLDLQTLLTSAARAHAKANGWYGERRQVQYAFVLALGAAALGAGIAILWLTRRTHAAVRLALGGLIFIGLFVLLRAASFHHLDEILGRGAPAFNWGSIQEMTGILMVAGAAMIYARTRKESR